MNPYLANFWQGARIATFRRVRKEAFRADWPAFWLGIAVLAVIKLVTGYFAAEPPVYFNIDGLQYFSMTALGYLACGFAGVLLLRDQSLQSRVPVLMLYAGLLPILIFDVFYNAMRMPWWAEEADLWAFYGVYLTWLFLAFYRSLDLCVPAAAVLRQYVLAGLMVGIIAVPPYYMYTESFFETDYSDYERDNPYEDLNTEDLLQSQHRVLERALDGMKHGHKGRMDAFIVTFGSYGSQDVFKKEATLARDVFSEWFGAGAQGIALVNNPETARADMPLATATNLRDTLHRFGKLANHDEDLLVIYMTSHGYQGGTLSVDMGPIRLNNVPPEKLREMLDESGFKWRVVVVSACYSGGMIEALKDDNSIVLTAAAPDKTSFGCSDDAELTYFGRALLEDALPLADGLIPAFEKARTVVTEREKSENIPPSNPQLYIGPAIAELLQKE